MLEEDLLGDVERNGVRNIVYGRVRDKADGCESQRSSANKGKIDTGNMEVGNLLVKGGKREACTAEEAKGEMTEGDFGSVHISVVVSDVVAPVEFSGYQFETAYVVALEVVAGAK